MFIGYTIIRGIIQVENTEAKNIEVVKNCSLWNWLILLEMIPMSLISQKETYGYEIITELNNNGRKIM